MTKRRGATALFYAVLSFPLPVVNWEHPFCDTPIDLDISKEYFVEVTNALPEVEVYNKLVRAYQKREWGQFDTQCAEFRRRYHNTPLQEASDFLYVQSKFDRWEAGMDPDVEEKLFRETLIRYPNSTLVPVLIAGSGYFWLKARHYSKSLSRYESGRNQFASHRLQCVFRMGASEAQFALHEWDSATTGFEWVEHHCKSRRLRVGAMIRLADIEWISQKKNVSARYERIFSSESYFAQRFFPFSFVQFGELSYRLGQLSRSRYYFTEYLKSTGDKACSLFALKRLADISGRTSARLETVVGQYLAVGAKKPDSDLGRISKIHAYLLESDVISQAEYQRRSRIIEEETSSIADVELRQLAILERGLVLLFQEKIRDAFRVLQSWRGSPLGITRKARDSIVIALMKGMLASRNAEETALSYLQNSSILHSLLGKEYRFFWMAVYNQLRDHALSEDWLNRHAGEANSLPQVLRPYFQFTVAQTLRKAKRYPEAETVLLQMNEPVLRESVLRERLALYQETEEFEKAYEMAWALFQVGGDKFYLNSMRNLGLRGALWTKLISLGDWAKKNDFSNTELAHFQFATGKALYELDRYEDSIMAFEDGIRLDPTNIRSAEAQFKKGQCLSYLGKKDRALVAWRQLENSNILFWSSLARNEILSLR